MASCRILSVSVLLLLLLVGQQEVKGSNIWNELSNKYGSSNGPYIGFVLWLNFGFTAARLDNRLKQMERNRELTSLCQYVNQTRPSSCSPPSSSSSKSLKEIASHLIAECCKDAVVNGEWGRWTYGACSTTCGGGTQTRTRLCNSPAPANGGRDCPDSDSERVSCNTQSCPTRQCSLRSVTGKIGGGNPAKRGEYPWLARLLLNGVAECGAVIVSNSYVLTAGHCLEGRMTNNVLTDTNIEVLAGQFISAVSSRDPRAQRVSVVRGIRHNDYIFRPLLNDIAVLGLDPPLEYSSVVSNICLPDRTSTLPPQCTVAGWGRESFAGQVTPTLYEVELDVYNRTQCLETFPPSVSGDDYSIYTNDGSMCAANGTSGGKDACEGDSGSGLMCNTTDATGQYLELMGIVSSGYKCAEPGVPGIYVYVPYYVDWIIQTIETLQAQAAASNSG